MEYNQNQRPAENGQPVSQQQATYPQQSPYQQPYVQQPSNPYQQSYTPQGLRCPQCGSTNVNVQMVTDTKLVDKHHGCLWWVCIGWWWIFVKWLIFTIPALIFKIFGGKKQKLKQKHRSVFVCQNCGNHWTGK